MTPTNATRRIVAGAPAVLTWQATDSDGEPADPGGTVTVTVTRSDGSAVLTDAATTGEGDAPRSVELTPTDTADLDLLTAVWSVDDVERGRTVTEVAGPPIITYAQFVAADTGQAAPPVPAFLAARDEVEAKFHRACARALRPRFAVDRLTSISTRPRDVRTVWPDVRRIRRITTDDGAGAVTVWDDEALAALVIDHGNGIIRHPSAPWPFHPNASIEVAYEYGLDAPPPDLRKAIAHAIALEMKSGARVANQGIATEIVQADGSRHRLPTPGLGHWVTGVAVIDEAVKAYVFTDWQAR